MRTIICYNQGDEVIVTKNHRDYRVGERLRVVSFFFERAHLGGSSLITVESLDNIPHESRIIYCYQVTPVISKDIPFLNHDRILSNQVAGMSLEEAIFQDGFSAGVESVKADV